MSTLLLSLQLEAQISPGDLTQSHADLEGIRNCTKCHTLGDKVSNQKCLECHKEIAVRIDELKGYHASKEVIGKDCATCHSEHHGRKFDMVRFDEDNFNHNLTGYKLTGEHKVIDCRECHIPDFIDDPEIKKKDETYLGLQQDCISCHEDYHQNTLASNDCASCHSTEAFAPADFFDHEKTKFALKGKHKEVECIDCHQKESRNNKDFQHFADVPFTNCKSCHDDPHQNNLGTNCKTCHTEDSFSALNRIRKFNHSKTKFPLKGAHKKINCAECHQMDEDPKSIFQDQLGVKTNACISCHDDVHNNKFGSNCAECHNEESFHSVRTDNFNHSKTDFELVAKHNEVDCRQCHTQSFTDPVEHNTCAACHTDYHEGQFVKNTVAPDCAECHTEEGFDIPLYTIEDHAKTEFPLDGGHVATPCFACHLQDDKWEFRNIGIRCVDCHEDVHEGYIDSKYYPEQTCENCHQTASWFENTFDHSLTAFELQGVHAELECMTCHSLDDKSHQNAYEGFVDLSSQCHSCHENVHEQQFEIDGITDCARCHGFENWDLSDFNHDNTAFRLEGKHAEVACEACHKEIEVEDKIIVQYKFESFECIDCHQ